MSNLNFHKKSKYINTIIKNKGKLSNSDTLAYKYLYEIVDFLVQRKLNIKNLPSDYHEEIVQNIITDLFIKFGFYKESNKELGSIFPYISVCVMSELCKLNRNKYKGQIYIQSGYDLDLDFDETGEFSSSFIFEADSFYHFLKITKKISTEVKNLINEAVIPVHNKKLFLFPLLLAIIREDHRMLLLYPIRISTVLRHIFNEIGSPLERIKK